MKEDPTNELGRNFLSVVAGVITAIAAGALLIPVAEKLLDRFFHIYFFTEPPPDSWKDDLMVEITLFGWLFIASIAGGLVCTLIASNREILNVLISSLVSLAIVFIISKGDVVKKDDLLPSLLILLGIPLGNLVGGWMGGVMKRKRRKEA